jgi:hypothetical protein
VIAHEVPAILSLTRPSDTALEHLQQALATEEDPDGATRDFIEMRARIIDEAWRRFYRTSPGAPLPAPFPFELLPTTAVRPAYTHGFVRMLRVWAELIEIAQEPWPRRIARGNEALARLEPEANRAATGINGIGVAAGLFQQAIRPDVLIYDRSSRTAVAIERYRAAHDAALPSALTDLVPQYLAAVPEDPITGQPLRYRATAEAYMVYSVGPDGTDDGGMLLRQTPPASMVRFTRGADIGVRVLIKR